MTIEHAAGDTNTLIFYVIYENPLDYPGLFVLRKQHLRSEDIVVEDECRLAVTLEGARSYLPLGLHNIGRYADDDLAIKEVWI